MDARARREEVSPTRRAPWNPPVWLAVLLVAAAFAAAHGPREVGNLPKRHWEDGRHFRHNRDQVHSLADCFTTPSAWPGGNEATYRPLSTNCYYLAGRVLFGNRLAVYHAISAGVYVLNGVLLFLVARRLLPGPSSLVPPVLFVSRIAHAQVAAYTSEFDALSYVTLGLAGLLLLMSARNARGWVRPVLATAAFAAALLCKEAAVVWPAIVTVYGGLFDDARHWRRYVLAWLPAVAWAAAYPAVIRWLYPSGAVGFAFDLRPLELCQRQAAYLLSFSNLLVPAVDPEKAGWAMPPDIVALAGRPVVAVAVACLGVLMAAVLVRARVRPAHTGPAVRVIAFGGAWFFGANAPFAAFADRLFMRYAYLGHAGLALAIGGAVAALASLLGPIE